MTIRRFGYLPDLPDVRDAQHAVSTLGLGTQVVERTHHRDAVLSVLDQGSTNACVAFSVAQAIRCLERRIAPGSVPELTSLAWLWWHSRNQHGAASVDSGTYFRTCLMAARKLGRPPEGVWPWREHNLFKKPSPAATMAAHDRRRISYHALDSSGSDRVAQVKALLSPATRWCPVLIGVDFTQRMVDWSGGAPIDPPAMGEAVLGGHALVIVDYDEHGVSGPNSWGRAWGEDGWFRLSWDLVCHWRARDLWAIDAVT